MRLNDFTLLSQTEKITLLYNDGVYIGKRKFGWKTVLLYQLDGFYIEIYYRRYRRFIEQISCFSETLRLDPYLNEINLEHLV